MFYNPKPLCESQKLVRENRKATQIWHYFNESRFHDQRALIFVFPNLSNEIIGTEPPLNIILIECNAMSFNFVGCRMNFKIFPLNSMVSTKVSKNPHRFNFGIIETKSKPAYWQRERDSICTVRFTCIRSHRAHVQYSYFDYESI